MMTLLLLLALAFAGQTAAPPSFDQYSVTGTFTGTPAQPVLKTRGQRTFRTMIRDAAKQGPNFAGHYTIAQWGCGAACVSMAVIDDKTGAVYDGPFGALPGSVLYIAPEVPVDNAGLQFHLNSRLMIARGCPQEKNCATYYYEWTGSQFRLLRKEAFPSH